MRSRDGGFSGKPLTRSKGYNFKSLQHVMPFLEPSGSGISSLWARTTALKYDCVVAVGYPEKGMYLLPPSRIP